MFVQIDKLHSDVTTQNDLVQKLKSDQTDSQLAELQACISSKDKEIKQLQTQITSLKSEHESKVAVCSKSHEDKVKELEMEVSRFACNHV